MRWPSTARSRSIRPATAVGPRRGMWSSLTFGRGLGEVVADGVRQDEVAVGQALHQRGGAEAVGAVVGEIGLADHEQARDGGHQVVVHPQSAHRVVHRRVDAHRHRVGVLAGDASYISKRLPYLSPTVVAPRRRSRRRSPGRRRARRGRRPGPRRRPPWRRARRCRAARGCRTPGTCAPGSSRARPRGCRPDRACRLCFPAPRCGRRCGATRYISVSLDWYSPVSGMQVGWIWV